MAGANPAIPHPSSGVAIDFAPFQRRNKGEIYTGKHKIAHPL